MSGVRSGAKVLLFVRLLLLGALVAWWMAQSPARAELIDRVVASVNNDVITLSELRQAVAFNRAMGGAGTGKQMERETLEGLINRRLLLQEAGRIHLVEVSEADVAAEQEKLRGRFGTEDAYRAFLASTGLTETQLSRILGERLLVERFVQKKIELFARVTHDEAQSYYAEHGAEFKGLRFTEVQPQITTLLAAQKTAQQLDQYLADLRARADIRVNPLGED